MNELKNLIKILTAPRDVYFFLIEQYDPFRAVFMALPESIEIHKKEEDIKYSDIKKLLNTPIDTNIVLNGDYVPFQILFYLKKVRNVYYIHEDIVKEFLKRAIQIDADDIGPYVDILSELNKTIKK